MTDRPDMRAFTERLREKLKISVSSVEVRGNFIDRVGFYSQKIGAGELRALTARDVPALYEFYFKGLSEDSRQKYHPYPLFHTPPASADDLLSRFSEWKKESNWIVLDVHHGDRIIATSELKRIGTDDVTSGIAVRDDYQGKSIGFLLRTAIVEQARLLKVPRLHVKVVRENIASIKLHERCGFVNAGEVQYTHILDGKERTETVIKMEIIL